MTTPKGMRCQTFHLESKEQIFLYSNAEQIVLQLRRQVPGEEDILSPSFKSAVLLTPSEALAAELASIELGSVLLKPTQRS